MPNRNLPSYHIKKLREKLEMTQEQFSRLLGVSSRTIMRWESDQNVPVGIAKVRLNEVGNKAKTSSGVRELKNSLVDQEWWWQE